MLNYIFKLKANNTTITKEITAGSIIFLTMLYIIFVNPVMLSSTGLPLQQVFIATCIMIFISGVLVAFFTNLPLAIAPGMGLNAIFVYDIVATKHYSFEIALMVVFLSGLATFIIFLIVPAKNLLIAIPNNLKAGIVAGTGIFLFLIGLNLSGFIVSSSNTLVTLGNIHSIPVIFAFLLFLIMFVTINKNFNLMPLVIFILAIIINLALVVKSHPFNSFINNISFSSYHLSFFALHLQEFQLPLLGIIMTLFFAGNFDSLGTFISYQQVSNTSDKGIESKIKKIMLIKGVSSMMAGVLGTSTMTIFLESNVGVKHGGRTGLTALTVAVLFLCALLLKPLLTLIPAWASSPILLCVGALMLQNSLSKFTFNNFTEYLPAILAMLFIPLTYSITNGIAISLISYIIIKIISLQYKQVHWLTYILASLFAIYLMF